MNARLSFLSIVPVLLASAPAALASDPIEQWATQTSYWGKQVSAVDSQDNLILGPGTFAKIAPDGTLLFERDAGEDAGLPKNTLIRWLAIDSDDNIFLTGKQEGGSVTGLIVFKYDPAGNQLWHTITSSGIGIGPEPIRIAADESGDVYVFGETFGGLSGTEPTGHDFMTVKYRADGGLQWARTAHWDGSEEPFDMDVRDGRVAVTGKTSSGFLTVAYDYAGNELWRQREDQGLWGAEWVEIGAQGQVVICGWGWTGVGLDYAGMVVQYDAAGDLDWRLFHNSPAGPVDNLRRLVVADNGDIAVAGWTDDIEGWSTLKVDTNGNLLWSQYEPGHDSAPWEQPNAVTMGPAGEVYVAGQLGHTSPLGPVSTLIKYAPDGTREWLLRPSVGDYLETVQLDATGALLAAGSRWAFRIVDPVLTTFCTAKSGLACGPVAIGHVGAPSASATAGFDVFAGPAIGGKLGLFLYSLDGRGTTPFLGGTLCVATPFRRTAPVTSSGAPGSCGGQFGIDMNAFAQGALGGNPDPALLLPGTLVDGQWWGRDTASTGAFLSDGIEYTVRP